MRFLLSIIFTVAFFGCSNKTTDAPGTASETINCYIVYSDGTAANSVNVIIIKDEESLVSPDNLIKDTSKTNSNGFLTFSKEDSPLNLQCITNGEAIFLSSSDHLMKNLGKNGYDTLKLTEAGKINGKIITEEALPEKVFLKGTTLSAKVQRDSTYSFSTVPEGPFSAAAVFSSDSIIGITSLKLSSGESKTDTVRLYNKNFLLDDFDDGDTFTTVFIETGANWEDLANPNTFLSVKEEGALFGNSLEALHITQTDFSAFTIVCPFKNPVKYDLSNCKALSFWIKGTGTIHVSITGWRLSDTANASFTNSFSLPSQWTYKRIAIEDFTPDYAVTWAEASGWIQSITLKCNWTTEDTVNYMIDEVIFHGTNKEEFLLQ